LFVSSHGEFISYFYAVGLTNGDSDSDVAGLVKRGNYPVDGFGRTICYSQINSEECDRSNERLRNLRALQIETTKGISPQLSDVTESDQHHRTRRVMLLSSVQKSTCHFLSNAIPYSRPCCAFGD